MFAESLREPTDDPMHPAVLKKLLGAQLAHSRHDLAAELLLVLDTAPEPYSDIDVAQAALDRLNGQAATTADKAHPDVADDVADHYPDSYLLNGPPTPRRYMRANGLPGAARLRLNDAHEEVIAQSKVNLRAELDTDRRSGSHVDHGVTLDSTQVALPVVKQRIADRIETAAATIQELLPRTRTRILASRLLSGAGIDLHPMPLHEIGGASAANLNRAFGELIAVFGSLARGHDLIVEGLVEHLKPTLDATVRGNLRHRYERIATVHANEVLPDLLELAYDAAAYDQAETAQIGAASDQGIPAETEPGDAGTAETEAEAVTEPKRRVIGALDSPFEWAPGREVAVSIAERDGVAVLYCQALADTATKISGRLRSSSRDYADLFDALWSRTINLQLARVHGANGYRSIVVGITSSQFSELEVHKFGNIGPNAKRIYYLATTVKKFTAVAELADASGVNPDTPLMILVGETDKKYQPALLRNFGSTY